MGKSVDINGGYMNVSNIVVTDYSSKTESCQSFEAQKDTPEILIAKNAVHCNSCMLRKLCLAADLEGEILKDFDDLVLHKRPLSKGKHLYWQDSPFKSIYIVHSGAVRAYRISPQGKERVLGFYFPGELIGTDGLYNDRYANSTMALDTTTVCELPFQSLSKLFNKKDSIQKRFLSVLSAELLEEQHQHLLCQKTAEQRMAAFLLNLSHRFQRRNLSAYRFQLPMTRKDIACYLGLAIETVSRVLSRFQEKGWLELKRRDLTLLNPSALEDTLSEFIDEIEL